MEIMVTGTGSGLGLSFWDKWSSCPYRAYLDYRNMIHFEATESEEKNLKYNNVAALTGTCFHAILEAYYGGLIKPESQITLVNEVELDDKTWGEASDKALYAFKDYKTISSPKEFGDVVAIEERLGPYDTGILPDDITGQVDLVTYIDHSVMRELDEYHNIPITEGYYLIDHKTTRNSTGDDSMYSWLPQLTLYTLMWNKKHPDKILSGVLINKIIMQVRTTRRKIVHCGPITKPKILRLENKLKYIRNQLDGGNKFRPNISYNGCFQSFGGCKYKLNGVCKGY